MAFAYGVFRMLPLWSSVASLHLFGCAGSVDPYVFQTSPAQDKVPMHSSFWTGSDTPGNDAGDTSCCNGQKGSLEQTDTATAPRTDSSVAVFTREEPLQLCSLQLSRKLGARVFLGRCTCASHCSPASTRCRCGLVRHCSIMLVLADPCIADAATTGSRWLCVLR